MTLAVTLILRRISKEMIRVRTISSISQLSRYGDISVSMVSALNDRRATPRVIGRVSGGIRRVGVK